MPVTPQGEKAGAVRASRTDVCEAEGWAGCGGDTSTPGWTEANEGDELERSWGRMVVGTKNCQPRASRLCPRSNGVPEVSPLREMDP